MKRPDMTGKVSRYTIAQETQLWSEQVADVAARVGAVEFAIQIPANDPVDGRAFTRSLECYTLTDALKIADYARANPEVRCGGAGSSVLRKLILAGGVEL